VQRLPPQRVDVLVLALDLQPRVAGRRVRPTVPRQCTPWRAEYRAAFVGRLFVASLKRCTRCSSVGTSVCRQPWSACSSDRVAWARSSGPRRGGDQLVLAPETPCRPRSLRVERLVLTIACVARSKGPARVAGADAIGRAARRGGTRPAWPVRSSPRSRACRRRRFSPRSAVEMIRHSLSQDPARFRVAPPPVYPGATQW
jgi:hypothetical protein